MRRIVNLKRRIHKQPKEKFNLLKNIDIFKYLSFLLIIIFILSIPAVIKKLIQINKIECTSQFGACDESLISRINISGNYLDVKKIIGDILESDFQVNNFIIQYKIPSTIRVDLTLKNPKFAIRSNDFIYLVDNDGLVISVDNQSSLPILSFDSNIKAGDRLDNKTMFALRVMQKINFLYQIDSGSIVNNELQIKYGTILLRYPLEGDIDFLVGGTRIIFSRLNGGVNGIRMEDIKEIDLRFANPVIR